MNKSSQYFWLLLVHKRIFYNCNAVKFLRGRVFNKLKIKISENCKKCVDHPVYGGGTIWSSGDLTFLWCPWHVSPPLHALLTLRCYLMEFYRRPLTYRHYVALSLAMQNMLTLRHSPLLTLLMVLSSLECQPCNKTMELGRVWCSLQGFWKLKFPHNYILIAPFEAILNQEWLMGIVKFLLGIRCFDHQEYFRIIHEY